MKQAIFFLASSCCALYAVFTLGAQPAQLAPPPTVPALLPIETTAPPETTTPIEMVPPETTAPAPTYDFTQPVPAREAVDADYFADAAFIGDSRTEGLILFSGIRGADCYFNNGLSIFSLATTECVKRGGEKITIYDALKDRQYKKIYLSLGVNELGINDDEGYYQHYLEAIDTIRSLQPDATLYLQGQMPLNEQKVADVGGGSYLKNDHLNIYNDLIFRAAQEKSVPFIDLHTPFADEDGQIPYDATRDGVHPVKEYYIKWYDYLKTHTVPEELL